MTARSGSASAVSCRSRRGIQRAPALGRFARAVSPLQGPSRRYLHDPACGRRRWLSLFHSPRLVGARGGFLRASFGSRQARRASDRSAGVEPGWRHGFDSRAPVRPRASLSDHSVVGLDERRQQAPPQLDVLGIERPPLHSRRPVRPLRWASFHGSPSRPEASRRVQFCSSGPLVAAPSAPFRSSTKPRGRIRPRAGPAADLARKSRATSTPVALAGEVGSHCRAVVETDHFSPRAHPYLGRTHNEH